jgi:hypothetical protein
MYVKSRLISAAIIISSATVLGGAPVQAEPKADRTAPTDQPSPNPSSPAPANQPPPPGQAGGSVGVAECGPLNAQIEQLQRSLAQVKAEFGGGFGFSPETQKTVVPRFISRISSIQADLDEKIALRAKKNCPN